MSLRCRMGMHRFGGANELVHDDSLAQGFGGITVIEAGYYRYWCTRCGRASDADRTAAGGVR